MTFESANPWVTAFDPQRMLALVSRSMQGPEEAVHVYRELLGLEGGSRERAVDFMAQATQAYGVNAAPFFEGLLRFGPTSAVRVAAAAYLAENGGEESVMEALESLHPPALTLTLLKGLLKVLAGRPATSDRVERLVAFGNRFADEEHYTTLHLGDFTGREVKRHVRRTIAESLLLRDAPDAAAWSSD
ncbi:MAG: hypothetical protein AB7R89_07500 [Dehalococcoidia bacterium]